MDGAYTDNQALAWTVARMQKRYSAGTLLRVIALDNNQECNDEGFNLRGLFALNNTCTAPAQPFDLTNFTGGAGKGPDHFVLGGCANMTTRQWKDRPYQNVENQLSAEIFAEQFPGDGGAEKNFLSTAHNSCKKGTYWQGILTTVDNPWYGVQSGWKVDLLYFSPNLDLPAIPSMEDAVTSAVEQVDALRKLHGVLDSFKRGGLQA